MLIFLNVINPTNLTNVIDLTRENWSERFCCSLCCTVVLDFICVLSDCLDTFTLYKQTPLQGSENAYKKTDKVPSPEDCQKRCTGKCRAFQFAYVRTNNNIKHGPCWLFSYAPKLMNAKGEGYTSGIRNYACAQGKHVLPE